MNDKLLNNKLRAGYLVFAALIIIKIGEYLLTTYIPKGGLPYLAVLAVSSAGLIIYYYKHIGDLWRSEGKDNE